MHKNLWEILFVQKGLKCVNMYGEIHQNTKGYILYILNGYILYILNKTVPGPCLHKNVTVFLVSQYQQHTHNLKM